MISWIVGGAVVAMLVVGVVATILISERYNAPDEADKADDDE